MGGVPGTGPAPQGTHAPGPAQAPMRPPAVERLDHWGCSASLPAILDSGAYAPHSQAQETRQENVEFAQQTAPHESRE